VSTRVFAFLLAIVALLPFGVAHAQTTQPAEKPTLSSYLQQGYDILHTEGGGGQFIFFILRKERTIVHCSVLLQSGETSSCRTLK
jgi:hypothetical protein